MHFFTTFVAIGLALSTASAKMPFELRSISGMSKRQGGVGGQAFQPGSTPTTCDPADTCGTDWCLDRPRGDVCCSEGYACPGDSFCLTQGYCCPNGLDPASCALQNGVTLSAGFNTATVPGGSGATTTAPTIPTTPAVVPSNITYTTGTTAAGVFSTWTYQPLQYTGVGAAGREQVAGGLIAAVAAVGYLL